MSPVILPFYAYHRHTQILNLFYHIENLTYLEYLS